jgi:beta-glucanase (GH16 family)
LTLRRTLATLAAGLFGAALLTSLTGSPAFADTPSQGAVLFEDDFTGAAASAPGSAWYDYSACTYDSSAAFGLIQCGDNETLDGSGHLQVPATPTAGSAIRTHFTAQYGTFSAWIKLPAEEGYWPAFWTLNNDPAGGTATSTAPVGEVDAMETWTKFSHQNPGLSKALGHTWTGSGSTDYHSPDNTCSTSGALDGAFHKYSAKIEPGKVSYYVDDAQCGQNYVKDTSKIWGLGPDVSRGNFMILDLAIGDAGGQQAAPTANATMLVDRVEVRALDEDSPAVVNGATYTVTNTCGGKAMAAPDATNIAQLKTANPSGTDDLQKWVISTYPNGKWKLKNVASGMTANVAYSSTANGAQVLQYTDNGGPNAEWTITPGINGKYTITNVNSGKALDVPANNTAAGVGLDQWQGNGSCGQTWQLVKL